MPSDRRAFLAALAAWAAAPGLATGKLAAAAPAVVDAPQLPPNSGNRRVVIVGGGWGGLSVARHLRALAPELEVVLLERNTRFWSGPLSNKWQAGLIGRDGAGRPTGWADPEPFRLHARADDRVFPIGDALGAVSPLFGHYPKSGHMANRQARIVAGEIAARAAGAEAPLQLPESVCYVYPDLDPPRLLRIDARYRVRGDGLIEQSTQQFPDPNPRDEDLAWATGMFEEFLAFKR